jgi:predicted AAA+ superfamily ATPase
LAEPEFSVPVGRIEYFHLGSISFEDFLKARGEEHLLKWIQTLVLSDMTPIPLHLRALELVKEFWLIGGMPEVVAHYAEQFIGQSLFQSYPPISNA